MRLNRRILIPMIDQLYHDSLEYLVERIEGLEEHIMWRHDDVWSAKALKNQKCRYVLYVEQHGKCCFCNKLMYADSTFRKTFGKKAMATLEHVKPRHFGGADTLANFKLSCSACNNERGVMDYDEFYNKKNTLCQIDSNTSKTKDLSQTAHLG